MDLPALDAAVADHGMIELDDSVIDADAVDELSAGVRALGGEVRARHVYTEPGAQADVLAASTDRSPRPSKWCRSCWLSGELAFRRARCRSVSYFFVARISVSFATFTADGVCAGQ